MKLKTLAAAVAVASMPFAAQADLAITGDITVGYFGDGAGGKTFGENGSEINIDASEKVGGITYSAHTELDFQNNQTGGAAPQFQEVRVGVAGGFGSLSMGETDNACDALDVGGSNETWIAHSQGGCVDGDVNNITYQRTLGPVGVALSHNPENKKGSAIGLQGTVGPAKISVGYEDFSALPNNTVVGLSGAFGPVSLGLRANRLKGAKTEVGANFLVANGANTFYGGLGNKRANAQGKSWSLGYNRTLGTKTTFIAEVADFDLDKDTQFGIGLKHAF